MQVTDETSSAPFTEVLFSSDRRPGQIDPAVRGHQAFDPCLGFPELTSSGQAICSEASRIDGCILLRLGSGLCFPSSVGPLDYTGVQGAHQPSRVKAVLLALQELEPLVVGHLILDQSDNKTVVACINHQGGSHLISLCTLAVSLWEWCILKGIHLLAAHIPGAENVQADFLSRESFSEGLLSSFSSLEKDLFASALNAQLPKFCSSRRDIQAWKVDALSFQLSFQGLFTFPPFSMILKVLEKVLRE